MTFKEDMPVLTKADRAQIQLENLTAATRLLEHGKLPYAEPIADPESLPLELLGSLYGLGKAACEPFTGFVYIAYTQFDPEVLKSWGIDQRYLRVVYGSSDRGKIDAFEFRDHILINPKIKPTSGAVQCMSERCGSIEEGNINMWVIRPYEVVISAHIWQPGMEKLQLAACKVRGNGAGFLEHEADHLDGLTAASETLRHRLVDFRLVPDSVALGLTVPHLIDEEVDFTAMSRKIERDWLVWNPNRETYEVINYKGDYIRDY